MRFGFLIIAMRRADANSGEPRLQLAVRTLTPSDWLKRTRRLACRQLPYRDRLVFPSCAVTTAVAAPFSVLAWQAKVVYQVPTRSTNFAPQPRTAVSVR